MKTIYEELIDKDKPKMKFLVRCKNSEVKKVYTKHKTHHVGDSGLDLFMINDITIGGGETRIVDLGIQCQLSIFKVVLSLEKKLLQLSHVSS